MFAETVQLGLDEWRRVDVFPFFRIFVDPQVGEHAFDLHRHQPRKDGVAGILRCRGQDGCVEFFFDIEMFGNDGLDDAPLVEPEIVDEDEEYFFAIVERREHFALEDVGAHHGAVVGIEPRFVMLFDKFAESGVGFVFLHEQEFVHVGVGLRQFHFPEHQFPVKLIPIVDFAGIADQLRYPLEFLPIVGSGFLRD